MSHTKRCLCGKFINSDGCGKCLHYVCARCNKVADHTNGTDDHPELCDACWSAEFADTTEAMRGVWTHHRDQDAKRRGAIDANQRSKSTQA